MFWTFPVSLTLNTAKQSSHNTFWFRITTIKLRLVAKGSAVQKIEYKNPVIWAVTVTLTLKIYSNSSCFSEFCCCFHDIFRFWFTVMYHHTKFAYKRFHASEAIIDLDNHSSRFWTATATLTVNTVIHYFTGHFGLWWSMTKLNLVAKESIVPKIYSHILIIVTLTWAVQKIFCGQSPYTCTQTDTHTVYPP